VRHRLLAGLAVLVLVAGCAGGTSPTPTAARPLKTIHVLEDPIEFTTVQVAFGTTCPTKVGCPELKGQSRMLDSTTQDVVGIMDVACMLVDESTGLYHCPTNAITLTGRGQIVFDERVYIGGASYPEPWPIIIGTGEFLGRREPSQAPRTAPGASATS
jgi:hypothetical protein